MQQPCPANDRTGGFASLIQIVAGVLLVAWLSGCASHRLAPECKGPYTPVNQSPVASTDGTQSRH